MSLRDCEKKGSKLVIIGGGISGLALGWFLKQRFKNASITILEKSDRPGGWIRTHHCDSFLFEEGPRSCRSHGTGITTLELIESLKLEKQWLPAATASQKRFLYTDKKLQQIPQRTLSFLISPLMRSLIRALCKEWRIPPCLLNDKNDESIYDFISRRFNRDVAEKLIDPLISGIYAGDIRQLSIRSCFPWIYDQEQLHGSLTKSFLRNLFNKNKESPSLSSFVKMAQKTPIFTLKDGMEVLITSLAKELKDELRLNTAVAAFELTQKGIKISTNKGTSIEADHVFIATPEATLKDLLKPLDIDVPSFPCASLAVINIGWHQSILKEEGFGYLVPSCEKENVLGMVWDSSVFPGQNKNKGQTRVTAMLGGIHRPDLLLLPEEQLIALARDSLKKHLNISAMPDAIHAKIAIAAVPQYTVGHLEKRKALESALAITSNSRIHLLGSAWYGVAVNDCIANAKKVAMALKMD